MIDHKKKITIAIIIFVLFVSIISIIYLIVSNISNQNKTKDASITNIYNDPLSGEVLYETPNKESEKSQTSIIILGISKLLDAGLTNNQLDKLRQYYDDYSLTLEKPVTEISVDVKSIEQSIDQSNNRLIVGFPILINRETNLRSEVISTDINNIILNIYNNNDKIYSSVK
jgi:hypothetical protein